MQVTINGEQVDISPEATIETVLKQYTLEGHFVVEINGEIIGSESYSSRLLRENDTMEIIRFVGGG